MGFSLKKVAQAVAAPVQAVVKVAAPVIQPVAKVADVINPINLTNNIPVVGEKIVAVADKATGGQVTNASTVLNTPNDILAGNNLTPNLQAASKLAPAAAGAIVAGPQGGVIANSLFQSGFSSEAISQAGLTWLTGTPIGQTIKGIYGEGQDALNFWDQLIHPSGSSASPNAYMTISDPTGLSTIGGYETSESSTKKMGPNFLLLGAIGFLAYKLFKKGI